MFFFFLIGCPTKIKQSDDRTVRVCPKCHNNSVVGGKKRTWLEMYDLYFQLPYPLILILNVPLPLTRVWLDFANSFFIPLVPIHSANVWFCTICSWQVNQQASKVEPAQVGYPGAQGQTYQPQPGQPQYNTQSPPVPGYQPGYQQRGFAQAYPTQK